jgi:hypothetical protein
MSFPDNSESGMYIALAAPRGVGKTSVLTALLDEANEVLAGTRVSVEATGETRKRLNNLKNQLRGHLRTKEFVPDGIGGTQDIAQFNLEIRATGTDQSFKLEVLDYPGGLLESDQRGEQWKQVSEGFRRADVLILPIDATLLMEAATAWHHVQAEFLLNLAEIENVAVRQWAKPRAAAQFGPGLLVLAPVKGETYFADNGGTSNRSDELWTRVRDVYQHVIDAVRKESPGVTVMYCPIDTIGCVEVMRLEWPSRTAMERRPIAHYRVRGEAQLRRKGAADLFVAIVKRIFEAAGERQEVESKESRKDAKESRDQADADFGPFKNFWYLINGERKKRRDVAMDKESVAHVESIALKELQRTLEEVSQRPTGARVRFIEN